MKYDIFILHAREDAKFVRSLAKGFERINLSVLYKESLAVHNTVSTGPLRRALNDGFSMALYGIIVISKEFFEIGFGTDDLDHLSDIFLSENQILHPLWYYVTDSDVTKWFPKLAMNLAIRFPPETVDSIARKFLVKLAGSAPLQRDALTGFHAQIQYISPKVSPYRPPESQMSNTTYMSKQEEDRPISEISSLESVNIAPSRQSNALDKERVLDDEPILECFDLNVREDVCRRLDVYLKGLSNWKDLAAAFRIKDNSELRKLSDSKEPTLHLLDRLAGQGLTVGQLKLALQKIERHDVIESIERHLLSLA